MGAVVIFASPSVEEEVDDLGTSLDGADVRAKAEKVAGVETLMLPCSLTLSEGIDLLRLSGMNTGGWLIIREGGCSSVPLWWRE